MNTERYGQEQAPKVERPPRPLQPPAVPPPPAGSLAGLRGPARSPEAVALELAAQRTTELTGHDLRAAAIETAEAIVERLAHPETNARGYPEGKVPTFEERADMVLRVATFLLNGPPPE